MIEFRVKTLRSNCGCRHIFKNHPTQNFFLKKLLYILMNFLNKN